MQPVEHLPAAAPDAVELAGAAAAPSGGRCDGASGGFATLGLQLERVRAAQPHGVRVEVWFQDEARIGQKNSLTRVWGQTGSRPAAPKDLGFASAYVFGAVCPLEGKTAALIMPICNTVAMNHHLREISSQVAAPGLRRGRLCPCRGDPRWCGLAPQPRTRSARQYHFVGAAAVQPGAQSGRADLARSAQSLARQLDISRPGTHHGRLRGRLAAVRGRPRLDPLALRRRLGSRFALSVGGALPTAVLDEKYSRVRKFMGDPYYQMARLLRLLSNLLPRGLGSSLGRPSEAGRGELGRFAAPQRHDVIGIRQGDRPKSGANRLGQGIPSERFLEQ